MPGSEQDLALVGLKISVQLEKNDRATNVIWG